MEADAALPRNDSEQQARRTTHARTLGLRRRSSFARGALALNAVVQGGGVALSLYQIVLFADGAESVDRATADANLARFNTLETLSWMCLLVGAVGFLRWLHGAMGVAKQVVSRPLAFTTSGAVGSFFIPIVSLWRPYKAIRDLDAKIEPSDIPLPEARPAESFTAGYRDAAIEVPRQRPVTPRAPVLLWWIAWLVPALVSIAGLGSEASLAFTLSSSLLYRLTECAGAILASVVVVRIQRRLEERAERLLALS